MGKLTLALKGLGTGAAAVGEMAYRERAIKLRDERLQKFDAQNTATKFANDQTLAATEFANNKVRDDTRWGRDQQLEGTRFSNEKSLASLRSEIEREDAKAALELERGEWAPDPEDSTVLVNKRTGDRKTIPGKGGLSTSADVQLWNLYSSLPEDKKPEFRSLLGGSGGDVDARFGKLVDLFKDNRKFTALDSATQVQLLNSWASGDVSAAPEPGQPGPGGSAQAATVTTQEEYDALPPGAEFIDAEDGKRYRKPAQ